MYMVANGGGIPLVAAMPGLFYAAMAGVMGSFTLLLGKVGYAGRPLHARAYLCVCMWERLPASLSVASACVSMYPSSSVHVYACMCIVLATARALG
jgi:hypothetical protein